MALLYCLEGLRCTPFIEAYEFTFVEAYQTHPLLDPVRLPRLRSLYLEGNADIIEFLMSLVLPSLQYFEIVFRYSQFEDFNAESPHEFDHGLMDCSYRFFNAPYAH